MYSCVWDLVCFSALVSVEGYSDDVCEPGAIWELEAQRGVGYDGNRDVVEDYK